jgi:hypothetical protein
MKKISLLLLFVVGIMQSTFAVEGMWIPSLIEMFYSDMKTYGVKLKPHEIYSTNKSSLKDAIVQFNGGCTAEIVSEEGLLLTNHHCGFDAIQRHSSLENDYLKNGFWAKNKGEEIACPWMNVTFVKEIKDVSKEVLAGVKADMSAEERAELIAKNIKAVEAKAKTSKTIKAKIKAFNKGNQYFMLVTEDFNDIRLVGAPPSAIGKYGGDTDNWVWPRHTGDFAVFRIYANKDNESAEYNEENKPYKPKHFLPINVGPKKEGDFTMVYGFPGSTDQHYVSGKLKFYMETERPARIKMRQMSLDVIKPAMNSSDQIRIQYASKQASIANAWKKWIGQIGGLKQLDAIAKKQAWEKEYTTKAASKDEWKKRYGNIIQDMNDLQAKHQDVEFARAMFIEYFFVGPEFLRYAYNVRELGANYEQLKASGKMDQFVDRVRGYAKGYFKNYNKEVDQQIYMDQTAYYVSMVEESLMPKNFKNDWKARGEKMFKASKMFSMEDLEGLLKDFNEEAAKAIVDDPAVQLAAELYSLYQKDLASEYAKFNDAEAELMQIYVEGILTMFPKKKVWSDANSTMRIAYGKVEGSAPHDGMKYVHYTTIDGIMQKYDPENPDFELTDRFIELYEKGDFGNYTQDGELWVCFTASNHTTGGNSGSPVIDAKGRLMGINFDRSWESTMSDFMFDESRCRNIVVDIRYVLWVIDKYGEASHLIDEMKLVKK